MNEVNRGDTVFVPTCVCVSVFVCAQRTGQSDQFKTVKATDFKFDVHVPRGIPDMTPDKFFSKNGAYVKIHLAEICTFTSAFQLVNGFKVIKRTCSVEGYGGPTPVETIGWQGTQ